MTTRRPADLERIAESLADSAPVDWPSLERELPDATGVLARLRALEQLSEAHRRAREENSHADPDPMVRFRWGPLDVFEPLGEGAFGEVYRAREVALQRDVALKLRRAEAAGPARAWLDEARRLARVSHPNVVAVLGVAEYDGRAGLWTELVRGETLEQRLSREGPLPSADVALVGIELCRALAAVHLVGMLHGDLKAANVMREGGAGAKTPGRIVLMDFGAGQDGPPASPTTWTPLSAAPEALRGGPVDARSDQYALGALLYRLLTGRHPVEADSLPQLIERVSSRTAPPLRDLRPDLPRAMHQAVLQALATEPEGRHASLAAFERALGHAMPFGDSRAQQRRAALWAGAALVISAALMLVWNLGGQRRSPTLSTSGVLSSPATPAAPQALTANAMLLRRTPSGSEALVDGGIVRAGDRLMLTFRCAEPAWVYVFNEDATGAAFTLFPLSGLAEQNPLAAAREHSLPGSRDGRPFAWQVGEGQGGESFLVIAGRDAVPAAEALMARLAPAGSGAPAAQPPARVESGQAERGVGTLVEEPSEPVTDGALARLERDLLQSASPGVWVWRVRARHAAP